MTAAPLQQQDRILILDAVRGVAVCGILLMNITGFSGPEQWFLDLSVRPDMDKASIVTWYLDMHILEGTFRGLFSLLFGAGAVLLTSRLEKSEPGLRTADIYYIRIIWLLIFGLFNAWVLLWVGDILYGYALCGLFLFPLRKSPSWVLILLVVLFAGSLMLKNWLSRQERLDLREKGLAALAIEQRKDSLTSEQKKDLSKWKEHLENSKLEKRRKDAGEDIEKMQQSSYADVWKHRQPLIRMLETTIVYDEIFFDAMLFILLGILFYRAGILTGEKPGWVYLIMLVVGYAGGISWGIFQGNLWRQAEFDPLRYADLMPLKISLYNFRRLFVTMGHLSLLVLLWKSGWFKWFIRPFANLGQMAFTNYLMQSLICTLYFHGYGLGYYGKLYRFELWYVMGSVWIFQLIFSFLWLRYFRFGPLEWVWRSLTYWKRQPFIREAAGNTVGGVAR